jgi:hypothetical protein
MDASKQQGAGGAPQGEERPIGGGGCILYHASLLGLIALSLFPFSASSSISHALTQVFGTLSFQHSLQLPTVLLCLTPGASTGNTQSPIDARFKFAPSEMDRGSKVVVADAAPVAASGQACAPQVRVGVLGWGARGAE